MVGECDVAARDVIDNDRLLTDSDGQLIEIDLSEVTFMDSAGIHCLLEFRKRAERYGPRLVVTHPSPPVRRVLEVSGLMSLLEPDSAPGRP